MAAETKAWDNTLSPKYGQATLWVNQDLASNRVFWVRVWNQGIVPYRVKVYDVGDSTTPTVTSDIALGVDTGQITLPANIRANDWAISCGFVSPF